jgi:hypothetical protein
MVIDPFLPIPEPIPKRYKDTQGMGIDPWPGIGQGRCEHLFYPFEEDKAKPPLSPKDMNLKKQGDADTLGGA